MNTTNKFVLAAMLTVTAGVAGLTPAKADIIWDFTPLTGTDIGPSATFTSTNPVTAISITAAGFGATTSSGANITTSSPVDLFSKNLGADEHGLGLVNDGDHEISGTNLIRIDFSAARLAGVTGFEFQMNSTTGGEGWLVFGSNSAATGYTEVASGTNESLQTLTGVNGNYKYYYFQFDPATLNVNAGNTNVLLHEVGGVSTVPLPAALPLFASGLAGLGLLGWRRKRKAAAVAA